MILASNVAEIIVSGFHWLRAMAGGFAALALVMEIIEVVKYGKTSDDE